MIYFVLMTELKATTNQKLRIYDTIATRTNSSNFFPMVFSFWRTSIVSGYQHFLFISGASFMQRSFKDLSSLNGLFFFLFFSWMYDLGVWARMTGSSKAQGQGDTYHFSWLFFFLVIFWASFLTILAGIACCCRLSDEKQAFQGHNWRIQYGP